MLRVKIGNQEILMQESSEAEVPMRPERVGVKGNNLAEQNLHTGEEISNTIQVYCSKLVKTFKELQKDHPPKRVVAEFGLSLTCGGDVFIVNTASKASLKITVEWEMDGYDKL